MRLRKVIYIAALSTLLLSGCASSNKEETQEPVAEDLTKITLAGKDFTIPVKVSDIVAAGFTLTSTDVETIGYNQDCIGYFENSDGATIVANIGSTEGTGQSPEEGYAFDVLEDVSNTQGEGVLTVHGGISLASEVDAVKEVYGEPTYDDGANQLYYKIIGDAQYSDMVCVAVINGEVSRVEVCNAKDFKELEVATPSEVEE